ncbi:MAG: hypothetical protein PWQ96_838 [Clostridia bacterium]|jgi:hypothetical protein|nr:hypothetical protein [Clostridia bacterium]
MVKYLRNYKIVEVPTFLEEDYEIVEFPEPIGKMEAFVAIILIVSRK